MAFQQRKDGFVRSLCGAGEKYKRHETVRLFRQKIGDMDEVALRRLDERRDVRARRRRSCAAEQQMAPRDRRRP